MLGSVIYWPNMYFYSFLSQDVPTAADFVKVSGLRFSSSDLLRMERIILDKLNWNLNATTPLYFLQVVSICNKYCTWNLLSFFLTCFFISISLFLNPFPYDFLLYYYNTRPCKKYVFFIFCSSMLLALQKAFLIIAQWTNIYNTSLLFWRVFSATTSLCSLR